jgi:response regulator RpfG family c-di-GMP phosphodiesterase
MENTGKEINVLFVYDDETTLSSLNRLFAEEPFEVLTAGSGNEDANRKPIYHRI